MVVEVLVLILLLHAVEAYVLNPKLMASKTRLPVPVVFIVLLVAEHYLHVWGLIIGVPLCIFVMHICNIEYSVKEKDRIPLKEKLKNIRKKQQAVSDTPDEVRLKDHNYYLARKYSQEAIKEREAKRMETDNNYYLAKKYYE